MHRSLLTEYGMAEIAEVGIEENSFCITVIDKNVAELDGCIYAFVIDDEIVRVGSSAGRLKRRLAAWRRDVTTALNGRKSPTPIDEAERWRIALRHSSKAGIYARQATTVTTPVGTFRAHLDEERVLIARHRPRLNRSSR